jgi:uncharacterized phage-associated protein
MINIFDVAKYILHSIGGEIFTMKLQKLCYYSQAWNLAWHGVPLFPEHFRKWDNGPVCTELFNVHRRWFSVEEEEIPESLLSGEEFTISNLKTINQILEDYGNFNGAQLSEISHQEDPWKNTPKEKVIPNETILKYYSSVDPDEAPTKPATFSKQHSKE